ncbi:MAG: glycosyltransferase family 2 protein [Acidobacteriia bacterium]|nr:glycosyltransferase family 2 protein [Terriglobia bacterium]
MKLSVVIVCWNDREALKDCLQSIYAGTHGTDFEVIVSDNGSVDGSVEFVRQTYPEVRVIENGANLGFAKGSNAGIQASTGQYVLILHPDTVIHDGALDRWVEFADRHPEAGGFGCRVLNPDGSDQMAPRPFPTLRGYWIAALYLWPFAHLSDTFHSDTYVGWNGDSERQIDCQADCCILLRGNVLKRFNGFDEQFFYQYAAADLCRRLGDAGYSIAYTPAAIVTHLGSYSANRFPIRFKLEKYRSRYRYFYKHFGPRGAIRCRRATLAGIRIRQLGYTMLNFIRPKDAVTKRLELFRAVAEWNQRVNPVHLVEHGADTSDHRVDPA